MLKRREQEQMINTSTLATDLRNITDRGKVGRVTVPWVYTNDFGLGDMLVTSPRGFPRSEDTLGVYLILGTGGLLSAAHHLRNRFDTLLIVDNNSFVVDWMKASLATLQAVTTTAEFEATLRSHPLWQQAHAELAAKGESLEAWAEIERHALGNQHFLASEENFQAAQRSLRGKPVFFSSGNLLHQPYVSSLHTALEKSGAAITCASVTDTADWHAGFIDSFQRLPFSEDAFIYWSTNRGSQNGHPIARSSQGIASYISTAIDERIQTSYQLIDPTQT